MASERPDGVDQGGAAAGRPSSADYVRVMAKAIKALDRNDAESRRNVYNNARHMLVMHLLSVRPPPTGDEVARERQAFEDAVQRVESQQLLALDRVVQLKRLAGQPERRVRT